MWNTVHDNISYNLQIQSKWHPMAVSFEKFTEGVVTCLVLLFDCCQSFLMKSVFPPPPGWQSTCSQLHDAYSLSSSPSPLLLLFQLLWGDECACHCRKQAGHWCLWPLFLSNFCLGISSKSAHLQFYGSGYTCTPDVNSSYAGNEFHWYCWWNRTHLENTVYIFTVEANWSVNPNLRDTFTGTVLRKKVLPVTVIRSQRYLVEQSKD